jgi:hypothetical protein
MCSRCVTQLCNVVIHQAKELVKRFASREMLAVQVIITSCVLLYLEVTTTQTVDLSMGRAVCLSG